MISSFDKSGAAKLYKREFIQKVNECDYESALDNLLKYHEEVGNADYHLACGILYFMMSQDSDDNELLVMAAREFMMHLRLFPDCRVAYRDLIGTHMLRHDAAAALECSAWASAHGFDVNEMYSELAEAGVELLMDESIGLDLEGMMGPGEFGEIDDVPIKSERDAEKLSQKDDGPRIIKFRGNNAGCAEKPTKSGGVKTKNVSHGDRVISINKQSDGWDDAPDISLFDEADDDEFQADMSRELIDELRSGDKRVDADVAAQLLLHEAEQLCSRGDFNGALGKLAELKPADGRFYYCAECLRAFIMIQAGDHASARKAVDRALDVNPHGALANTMLCKIYEDLKQFDKIPDALKSADVKDYTDAGHVYQAMRLAIEYCTPDDAIALAEEYIDEFNTMDIRMLYAQMLFNGGDKKRALRELYKLSRIFYDDFNTRYYYRIATLGAKRMPIDEDAPSQVLSAAVDAFLLINKDAIPEDEVLSCEEYRAYLELFLTLEYPNDRRVANEMFGLLRRLAKEPRLESRMRDALVSPYVEPIVKAVMLSELLNRSDEFLLSLSFCPVSNGIYAPPAKQYSAAFRMAFAFTVALARKNVEDLFDVMEKLKPLLDGSPFDERDKAYYMLEKLNARRAGKKLFDGRVGMALGFATKSEAAQTVKNIDGYINK